jgi:outer membrane receptor protein involved in Fe transport
VDTAVRLHAEDNKWEAAFIGRNLTDQHYFTYSSDKPGGGPGMITALFNRGRELILQFTFRFGKE